MGNEERSVCKREGIKRNKKEKKINERRNFSLFFFYSERKEGNKGGRVEREEYIQKI